MVNAPTSTRPTATVLWSPGPGVRRARVGRPGDVLSGIARARRTAALFGPEHPVGEDTLRDVREAIDALLARRGSLRFSVYEDAFFVENTVLLEESLQLFSLLADLREREIGTIEIHAGMEVQELRALVGLLNLSPVEMRSRGGPVKVLQEAGVRHIVVGAAGPPRESLNLKVEPKEAYHAGLRIVDELSFQASRDVPLDLRRARLVLNSVIDILAQDRVALLGVSALKAYDEDAAHHSVNVAILSLLVGGEFELSRIAMTTLGLTALLHDIGKVRVPRDILTKTGKLAAPELALVRKHTLFGAHILRNLPGLARLAMVVAFEHHANYDLSGYPTLTAKPFSHLLTRIVQVADFFDAATSSRRVYRRPMLPHEAMTFLLDRAGKIFDPVVARLFVRTLGLYPVNSLVELDTGDLAIVVRPGARDVTRPVVRVVRDHTHAPVVPHILSLEETRDRRIIRALDPVDLDIDSTAVPEEAESAVR